eukprot:CAMPEP_0202919890 /NCGR_PEP_ID=MMETSP1392-20130828/76566_1 /ASSEMBLY_ACC=CAM_ASM_000868 /TAXON_ID=225041 /ORGANISM="Chlamydomonas chlamydogama, Strain SAG 11-48b" /LENGTH=91 /DNA_ID=CAMNT_0049613351 /DNA_START=1330 /DNA_END=1605 /DNA_ORIENTATION=-
MAPHRPSSVPGFDQGQAPAIKLRLVLQCLPLKQLLQPCLTSCFDRHDASVHAGLLQLLGASGQGAPVGQGGQLLEVARVPFRLGPSFTNFS